MILSCPFFTPHESLISKVLPALVTSSVVLVTFIIGKLIDSKMKSKENNRTWYLRVIIEPNLKVLDQFILDSLNSLNTSIDNLLNSKSTLNFDRYIELKTIEIGKFQSIKRSFEFSFIQLIQANYPEIGVALSESIRGLEDKTTVILDKKDLNLYDYEVLKNIFYDYKNQLFYQLYYPLGYKKKHKDSLIRRNILNKFSRFRK
jgi:hypothetical protein